MIKGWIGVDADGTLFYNDPTGADFVHGRFGEPIKPMVDRVRKWRANGTEVRIFTARAAKNGDVGHDLIADANIEACKNECWKLFGEEFEVTATKDYDCVAIYDDRARQVIENTGMIVGEDT